MKRTLAMMLGVTMLAGCQRVELDLAPGAPAEAPLPGLMALRIDPTELVIRSDGVPPAESGAFKAIGQFSDGERDVSGEVDWSASEPFVIVTDGVVGVDPRVGGTSRIIARSGTFEASSALTIELDVAVVVPGAPADLPSMFPSDTSGDTIDRGDVTIAYPFDGTIIPPNVSSLLTYWTSDVVNPIFELRIDSQIAAVRLYTVASSLLATSDILDWLVRTHAGHEVSLTVRAISRDAPQVVLRSPPVTFAVSAASMDGLAYYWSTTAQGIRSARIESTSAAHLPTLPNNACAACHAVSRNGARMVVMTVQDAIAVVDLATNTQIELDGDRRKARSFALSPDGTKLVMGRSDKLELFDIDAEQMRSEARLPEDEDVFHLDWSPTKTAIVFALGQSDEDSSAKSVSRTRLMTASVDGDRIGPFVEILANDSEDTTLAFPSFSPDGRWIAFSRIDGPSKDNPASEIFIVDAEGSAPPIRLDAVNDAANQANTMASWALVSAASGSMRWLTFSSTRDYANVSVGARDQLWCAAINLDRAAAGVDPSHRPFWLSFQDPTEYNHRAVWTTTTDCVPGVEICDGRDDDCDGDIDEACCVPEPERCGDRVDNDCDGAVDEGCGCGVIEVCSNGLDDDCDGLEDSDDEDCAQ